MPVAEIIAIGTELLLGEIQDTNTRYLARLFRDAGIDLYRASIVGDNVERIAQIIQDATKRCQIVITTGGLGPTVDDPTRQAVALSVGRETEFHPELWDQIQERFKRYGRPPTENNRRQAFIPQGANAIENPVGTAPAFRVELEDHVIISLPGVPREMEYLMENNVLPYLKQHFQLRGTIKASVLHTAGVGESQIDEWVGDLETFSNPTVGLLARAGQIDVRVTAKADSIEEADQMIEAMVDEIKRRLGDAIFGRDEETLQGVTVAKLAKQEWQLHILECGMGGELIQRLVEAGFPKDQTHQLPEECSEGSLNHALYNLKRQTATEWLFGASFRPGKTKQELSLLLISEKGEQQEYRSYGGPPPMGKTWAVNISMDYLRRSIRAK
ncbi:MAG TPA: CinA family nicotinamide mononucleotide deamidase-related protein [Anaerolineaceae bacterium]|nr:CinA family nicotinamide mononucleotide deamidase-related protein [Anaerolineaceae bacterium]